MAEIHSFPNNREEYVGAEDAMKWLHGRTSGVFGGENNAAVLAVQGAMAVTVSDGRGWLAAGNGDGIAWWNDNEKETGSELRLEMDPGETSLNRIDRVVVSWATRGSGLMYAELPTISVLKGTPAQNPIPPTLTNNDNLRQISLAQVYVGKGAYNIDQKNITDERMDSNVCGLATAGIGVDTTVMYKQFNDFFDGVQEVLGENTAGSLLNMINTASGRIDGLEKPAMARATGSLAEQALPAHEIVKINLDTWDVLSDDPFMFENGGVMVPYDGIVMVLASVYFVIKTTKSNTAGPYVLRDGDPKKEIVGGMQYLTGESSLGAVPVIAEVKAGEIITLHGRSFSVDGKCLPNAKQTALTILYLKKTKDEAIGPDTPGSGVGSGSLVSSDDVLMPGGINLSNLITSGTEEMTPGESKLATGALYVVYE